MLTPWVFGTPSIARGGKLCEARSNRMPWALSRIPMSDSDVHVPLGFANTR